MFVANIMVPTTVNPISRPSCTFQQPITMPNGWPIRRRRRSIRTRLGRNNKNRGRPRITNAKHLLKMPTIPIPISRSTERTASLHQPGDLRQHLLPMCRYPILKFRTFWILIWKIPKNILIITLTMNQNIRSGTDRQQKIE